MLETNYLEERVKRSNQMLQSQDGGITWQLVEIN